MTETQTSGTLTVTAKIQISVERIKDMLCCAIEGGSTYWAESIDRMGGITREQAKYRQDVPFVEDGWLQVIEQEPGMPKDAKTNAERYEDVLDGKKYECYRLDMAAIEKGLQNFANKYPNAFADLLNENDDAGTGDTFLQCCLFGEAIYG